MSSSTSCISTGARRSTTPTTSAARCSRRSELGGRPWALAPSIVDAPGAPGAAHRSAARDGRRRGEAARLAPTARVREQRVDQGEGRADPGGRHRRLDGGQRQPPRHLRRPALGIPSSTARGSSTSPARSARASRAGTNCSILRPGSYADAPFDEPLDARWPRRQAPPG